MDGKIYYELRANENYTAEYRINLKVFSKHDTTVMRTIIKVSVTIGT